MDGINVCTSSVIHWSWKKFCHMRRILSYFLSASCYKIHYKTNNYEEQHTENSKTKGIKFMRECFFYFQFFCTAHLLLIVSSKFHIFIKWSNLKQQCMKRIKTKNTYFGCIIIQLMFSNHFFFKKSITCGLEGLIN